MNAYVKMILVGTAIAGLYAPAAAFAQKSAGGVIGDARLHPGTWSSQGSSRSVMRSQPTYRSAAPETVRSESAPTAVAQKPTEQRSFSYEPKEETKVSSWRAADVAAALGRNQRRLRRHGPPNPAAVTPMSHRLTLAALRCEPCNPRNDATARHAVAVASRIDKAMRAKGY